MDIEADLAELDGLLERSYKQKRRAKYGLCYILFITMAILAIAIRQSSIFSLICAIVNVGVIILMINVIGMYKNLSQKSEKVLPMQNN